MALAAVTCGKPEPSAQIAPTVSSMQEKKVRSWDCAQVYHFMMETMGMRAIAKAMMELKFNGLDLDEHYDRSNGTYSATGLLKELNESLDKSGTLDVTSRDTTRIQRQLQEILSKESP